MMEEIMNRTPRAPMDRSGERRTLKTSTLLALPFALSVLSCALPVLAQDAPAPATTLAPASSSPSRQPSSTDTLFVGKTSLYDAALAKRIDKEGNLAYIKIKGDAGLDAFVAALPSVDVSKFPVFEIKEEEGKEERRVKKDAPVEPRLDRSWELAFWINAHNALAIKAIADAYPVNSVDEIKDFDTRVYRVAGGDYTLPQIRAKAAQMDKRALFAMTDGTLSGPRLAPRAVRAFGLNGTLESSVVAYVNDPRMVELSRIQNKVAVNPFLMSVDEAWKPVVARRKWDGIRALLAAYTNQRANQSYFTTNEYQVLFSPTNRKLNATASEFDG
jgi:hypothetical protein